jgi:hypothetical protein
MCVPCGSAPRERIDLRAVGLRVPLTRLEVRGEARERLLSCRDPASRDPRTGRVSETCSVFLRARTPVRLLSARASRQARLRASFRLAPCVRREALRPPGDQDARCVQPTSATRTKLRVPVPRAFLAGSAACAACWSRRVWAPRDTTREGSVSRRSGLASAGLACNAFIVRREFHPAVTTKGLFDPRR